MKHFTRLALAPIAVACFFSTVSFLSPASWATPLVTQGGTAVVGQGLFTNATGATTIDFNNGLTPVDSMVSYSLVPGAIVQGSRSGVYAAPVNDTSRYLTVNPTGSAVMTFNQQLSYFGFFASSLDCYNSIDLKSNDVTVLSLNGAQLAQLGGFSANGDQSKGLYINIYSSKPSEYFNKVTFSSSNYAFETDNHAYQTATNATPEPGTFLLIGVGLSALAVWRSRG
jgi:hypothetical protein